MRGGGLLSSDSGSVCVTEGVTSSDHLLPARSTLATRVHGDVATGSLADGACLMCDDVRCL